jgi:hypothetical protein
VMNFDDKLAEIHEIPFPAVSDFPVFLSRCSFRGSVLKKYVPKKLMMGYLYSYLRGIRQST